MRFAAIETSTEWCSVAVWNDGEMRRSSAERATATRNSLADASRTYEGLEDRRGGFRRRAGAFTGLRIACALAQGLAFARSLPVIGISTLEALAQESGAARVLACIDARMREVYYAALEKRGGRWHEVIPAHCARRAPRHYRRAKAGWVAEAVSRFTEKK